MSISQYIRKEQPQIQDLMKQTSTFPHHLHPNHASEVLKHQSKLELHVMKVIAKGAASTDFRQKSISPMSKNLRTVQLLTARTRQSWLRPIFTCCGWYQYDNANLLIVLWCVDQVGFCTERGVHALMQREQENGWYMPTIKAIWPGKEAPALWGLYPWLVAGDLRL